MNDTHSHIRIINADNNPARAAHMAVRWDVFVHEQAVPMMLEIDARDLRPDVTHLAAVTHTGQTIGAVRIIPDTPGHYHLGRLAVRHTHRGQGVGRILVNGVHNTLQNRTPQGQTITVTLDAQIQAQGFYETLGYRSTSENTFIDAGIEHIEMATVLQGNATG